MMPAPIRAISENIALLAQFPSHLEEPTTNHVPSSFINPSVDGRRRLKIGEEQRLAEIFALLLATISDPLRVGAVCIEEIPDGSGFTVRTATNTGSQQTRKLAFHRIINAAKLELKSS
jgi:hypothetical protein